MAVPDKQADTVARAFHDNWLMRYGVPAWITTDNGKEFGGAFDHQLERLGVEYVHSSPYHPQSNGAVERLVRTMKSILSAKVATAVRSWPALLPQVRAEYMARVHSTTGFSPNELVFASPVKLPAPVGALHWDDKPRPMAASAAAHVAQRDARFERYVAAAYDRILKSQQATVERARAQLAASDKRGGETSRSRRFSLPVRASRTQKSSLRTVCGSCSAQECRWCGADRAALH